MSGFDSFAALTGVEAVKLSKVQPGSRGGSRVVETIGGFNLNTANNTLIVQLPKCVASTVTVTLQAGTWSSASVSLKLPSPGKLLAFSPAKDLAAEGSLAISESESLGLTQVAIVVTAAAGAFSLATITVSVEEAA